MPIHNNSGNKVDPVIPPAISQVIAGTVVMFSGTFGGSDGKRPIPKGSTEPDENWALCDGSNGTPNLVGSFIRGGGTDSSSIGSTGGNSSASITGSVSGSAEATTLTIAQIPSHGQHITRTGTVGNSDASYTGNDDPMTRTGVTSWGNQGGSTSHSHYISGSVSGTVSTLPPYYTLAYIMKIS